jgi:PAS domain S-box-containing protein
MQKPDLESARDAALDALRQSEELFRLLVDAVKDYAIFVLDLQGRIATWNPGAERITGFSAEEVVGKSVAILRPPDDGVEALEPIFERIRRDGSAEWDDAGLRKNGARYGTHVYCTTMFSRGGELLGYVSIMSDATRQRSLEEQRGQAQKLEPLGQRAGGVAHDFNNMLMVIFARCDILLRQLESDEHRQFVRDIRDAAGKNADLAQELLGATRAVR